LAKVFFLEQLTEARHAKTNDVRRARLNRLKVWGLGSFCSPRAQKHQTSATALNAPQRGGRHTCIAIGISTVPVSRAPRP
jgi:hypothetical protein